MVIEFKTGFEKYIVMSIVFKIVLIFFLIIQCIHELAPQSLADSNLKIKRIWDQTIKGYIYSSPMIADVTGDGIHDIVIGDQKGNLILLNGQTGKKIFETTIKGSINASPIIYDFDGNNLFDIILCSDEGKVYRVNPRSLTNPILWEWSTDSSINYTPALFTQEETGINQLIITDEDTNVYCLEIDKTKANLLWKESIGLLIRTSPALIQNKNSQNMIIISCSNGDIYVLDSKTGKRKEKYTIPERSRINATPGVGDINMDGFPDIVVGGEDQKIYAFSKGNLTPIWMPYKTNGEIIFSPVLTSFTTLGGPQIICTSMDNNCYILEGLTGKVLWTFPLDSKPSTQALLVDINSDGTEDIIIGTESGKVYIIDCFSRKLIDIINVGEPVSFIQSGDIDNNSTIDLLISSQQRVALYNTNVPIMGNTLLWPTIYGNLQRTNRMDNQYLLTINNKMLLHQQEVESLYNKALEFKASNQFEKALESFREVLILNSNHPDAGTQIRKIQLQKRRPIILQTTIGFLLLITLAAFWWYLRKSRGRNIKDAINLLGKNKIEEALKKHKNLLYRKEFDLLPELAMAYARTEQIIPEAIRVYEQVITMKKFVSTPTEIHYRLAQAYCLENRLDDNARLVYEMALQFKKDDKDILRAYGRASRAKNDTYTLIKQYEKLYNLGEKDTEVIVNLARGFLENLKTDSLAMQIYQQAIELNVDDKDLVSKVADIYISQYRFDDKAVQIYNLAKSMNPENIFYALGIAQNHLQNNKFQEVLSLTKPVLAKDPDNEMALSATGRAHLGLKEFTSAIEYLEKALERNPGDKTILRDLALSYAGAGNSDDRALEIFKLAAKNEPKSISLQSILTHAYVDRCDREHAMESLLSLEQLDPKNQDKLLSEYQELSKSFPANMDIRKRIFTLQLNLEYIKEGVESLQILEESETLSNREMLKLYSEFLKKDPENLKCRLNRAKLYVELENPDDAITDLEWVHQEKPNDSTIHELLEKLYSEKLNQNPNNLNYHFKTGILLYLRGDIERAIEHLQRTVKEGYREQESAKYLGLCFQKRGMLDLAYRQLSKLPMDNDMKDILYGLANDYTEMHQFSKALTVLEQIYAEDINYKDLKATIIKLREQTSTQGPVVMDTSFGTGLGIHDTGTVIEKDNSATIEEKRRYEILKELGRGNMGIVCLARDKELDEIVALKFLPQELHYDAMIVERFKQEVRSTRRLSHPNIVRIHDMGDERGRKFISMEYIDGRTIKDILYEKKKFLIDEVINITLQLCSALDYAHRMKVVHRDIKPANIMMTRDGTVKIMDFGIASMLERAGLTQTGALIGTPLYMSPEQSEGKTVDGRSDLYSMGAMLYELISGTPPFYSGNISYQHVHVQPPALEDVPEQFSNLIMKYLAKSPNERYQTAAEALREFEKYKSDHSQSS